MDVPGEDLQGVWGGVEFLRAFNMDESAWMKGSRTLGSKVAVIGGGNSAIDAARCAWRMGADVTLLYRRGRKEMPAAEEEVTAALDEDIKIVFLAAPLRIEGKDGKVSGITCERMKLGDFDRSGRKRPIAIPGSEFTLAVDAVVAAIGQVPDMTFVPKDSGVVINKWDCYDLAEGSKSRTTNPKFYAGGDAVTGPDTVIGAIAAGHRAAADIDAGIRAAAGEPAWEAPMEEKIDIPLIIDEDTQEVPQTKMPELHGAERNTSFVEVELGFTRELAIAEACRCLRCDAEV